jgi:hypothetical protein
MAGKQLTISLTSDQQKQIKNVTGKSISALHIDIASTGALPEADLEKISGGTIDTFLKLKLW